MNEKYNWNLKDIFVCHEDFDNCKTNLNELLNNIAKYQGKLSESSKNLQECYALYEKALEIFEKIYAYGMLTYHLDMSNQDSIKLYKEVENIGTNFSQTVSFMVPEITKMNE